MQTKQQSSEILDCLPSGIAHAGAPGRIADSAMGLIGADRVRWLVWSFAALAAFAYATVFYPGAMSFDSAYQWWQARGGESTNVQGIGMLGLWRAADALAPGPGAIFLLQLLLFWSGLALLAQHLSAPARWRLAFMLAAAGAPVCFLLFSHVWSDVTMMAVMTCAVGTMLRAREGRRLWLAPALALLFLAVTLRQNAAIAVFPLIVFIVHSRKVHARGGSGRLLRATGVALVATLLCQLGSSLLQRTVDKPHTLFAVTAEWDLTAISLDVGTILLPPGTHGPGLTLDDLRQAFVPYTSATLFARTRAGMIQPFLDPANPLNAEVRRAWTNAIIAYPHAYLAHRWRLTRALFGSKSRDWPGELVYFDGEYQFDGNPPIAPNGSRAHALCMRAFDAMRDTAMLSAWPYLLLALIALALASRLRTRIEMGPAIAVLASGVLYAAPLPFIAPSAELRYTGWTCLAALIGAALVLDRTAVYVSLMRARTTRAASR